MRASVDWKLAPKTPNAAASIKIITNEPWGSGSLDRRTKEKEAQAGLPRIAPQANKRTKNGKNRKIKNAAASNIRMGPNQRLGFTSRTPDAKSRETNPPRPLICHQKSPSAAKKSKST